MSRETLIFQVLTEQFMTWLRQGQGQASLGVTSHVILFHVIIKKSSVSVFLLDNIASIRLISNSLFGAEQAPEIARSMTVLRRR